jgi:hypothetical protein
MTSAATKEAAMPLSSIFVVIAVLAAFSLFMTVLAITTHMSLSVNR